MDGVYLQRAHSLVKKADYCSIARSGSKDKIMLEMDHVRRSADKEEGTLAIEEIRGWRRLTTYTWD